MRNHVFKAIIIGLLLSLFTLNSGAYENKTSPINNRNVPFEHLNAPGSAERNLPFSEAVKVGHTLYLSGQIGTIPGKLEVVSGGIQPETRQTMENIKAVLERHGATMDHLVKCTVFDPEF